MIAKLNLSGKQRRAWQDPYWAKPENRRERIAAARAASMAQSTQQRRAARAKAWVAAAKLRFEARREVREARQAYVAFAWEYLDVAAERALKKVTPRYRGGLQEVWTELRAIQTGSLHITPDYYGDEEARFAAHKRHERIRTRILAELTLEGLQDLDYLLRLGGRTLLNK